MRDLIKINKEIEVDEPAQIITENISQPQQSDDAAIAMTVPLPEKPREIRFVKMVMKQQRRLAKQQKLLEE